MAAPKGIYELVGEGITAWQSVEEGLRDVFERAVLCQLFGSALKGTHGHWMLAEIFYVPISIHSKLDMVEAALRHAGIDATLDARWDKLRDRVLKSSKNRNLMAHGTGIGNGGNVTAVVSNIYKSTAMRGTNDLQVATANFVQLSQDLQQFAIDVNAALAK